MDIAAITSLISTVGFPIVCVIAMGFFFYKVWQHNTEREDRIAEQQAAQMEKFSNSLDNFNVTLTRIDARLEAVEKKLE